MNYDRAEERNDYFFAGATRMQNQITATVRQYFDDILPTLDERDRRLVKAIRLAVIADIVTESVKT